VLSLDGLPGTVGVGVAVGDRPKNYSAVEVVVTNTLSIPRATVRQAHVPSIAPLISRAIREVFEDGSATSLFDGNA